MSEFQDIVASSEPLLNRWLDISERAARDVEAALGVKLDREALACIPELRIAVLSGGDYDLWQMVEEAKRVDGAHQHVERLTGR